MLHYVWNLSKRETKWNVFLNFFDGFAAGFRRASNTKVGNLTWLKSHYYQINMEQLLPLMFRGYLNEVM
jgi:hypothetical protein